MRKGIFICFEGMDASGKSTLARYVYEELKKRKLDVSYVWWLAGNDSLYRRALRSFGTSRFARLEMDGNSQKVAVTSENLLNRMFRVLFPETLILDNLRFAFLKAWVPKLLFRNKTVVFDRFIYDIVLAVSQEFAFPAARRQRLLMLCSMLTPKPDLIFVLNVPPEIAYARKSEEFDSIEHAKRVWQTHQNLHSMLGELTPGNIVQIDSTQDYESVKTEVLKATLDFLPHGGN